MENSLITWTDHTFNPWIGCTKVSPGCAHCYAETLMDTRYGRVKWGRGQPRSRTSPANWKQPLRWNREAAPYCENGRMIAPPRPRVFCASLADWLDAEVPLEWLVDLLDLIHSTPNLDWLLLTKRPQKWSARLALAGVLCPDSNGLITQWVHGGNPPANVWIGTTVEDQVRADERIPVLLSIPARVRFLSCEPLLEKVALRDPCFSPTWPSARIHWVICGCESGPKRRPMPLDWARSLRDQCAAARVPFFLKQIEIDGKVTTEPMLDGTPHHNFPEVR